MNEGELPGTGGAFIEIAWKPPEHRSVPQLRATVAMHMLSAYEVQRTADMVERQRVARMAHLSPYESTRRLMSEEHQRLSSAALYYVTADMTHLAVAASRSLPPFNIEHEDVPAPAGFMVFEEPVFHYDADGAAKALRVPTVAISWGPTKIGLRGHADAMWITLWQPAGEALLDALDQLNGTTTTADQRDWFARGFSPLQWQSEAVWPFGADQAVYGSATSIAEALEALRAAWLLMQQPKIIETTDVERPRAERKRDAREGLSTSPVRILDLRRAAPHRDAAAAQGGPGDYTCRWLVSGHWRQHWYPKRQVHRPVWIAPHLKGPEDKPLRTTETVHLWKR